MAYNALAIGLDDHLLLDLQSKNMQCNLQFTISTTTQEAGRLLNNQIFHLLIISLEYLRSIKQIGWLKEIRHISFVPLIVLSDTPEKDMQEVIHLGADLCISEKYPCSIISEFAFAQLRRYTEYNYYHTPVYAETASFQVGNIFIDPARRVVEIHGKSVTLRPREFSLLLYFMRNPNIVLTSEQICEHAWGMEGSYNQGVSHPVRLLRQAIEPDPLHPIYIETVHRVGYRFTAYKGETCEMC